MSPVTSPLAMLRAWHRLGEQQFAALRWLVDRTPVPATELAARDAAHAVLIYFDRTTAVHHRDEEDDLFPEMLASMAGSDPVCLRELASAATAGHRALESSWRRLRPSFAALSRGEAATLDATGVARLIEQCRQDFRQEERELIPMAERLLDDAALARIRDSMDRRHRVGAAPSTPG